MQVRVYICLVNYAKDYCYRWRLVAYCNPRQRFTQCLPVGTVLVSVSLTITDVLQPMVEIYNQYGYTAAHKSLPFGTRLRVCYQRCVEIRINDRGPFIGSRELDLSYGAAAAIGLLDSGVGTVKVTYL